MADPSAASKAVKRACTECRQQKARCDAHIKTPCTRCAKLQVHCVISSPFKREHKRKRLTELEHEAAVLRQRLQTSSSPVSSENAPVPASKPNVAHLHPSRSTDGVSQESFSPTITPRTIGNVTVSAYEINELFFVYFKDFHPWLPILEPQVSPDEYYARLPFLFWAIIAVASRRYTRNPTLPGAVAEKVVDEALLSLKTRSNYFYAVHGTLLLLNWPVAKSTLLTTTGPLAGAVVQMATQIGLHIPASAQDFARVKLHLSEADIAKRAELWTFVTLIYQRVCKSRGQQGALLEIKHTPQQVKKFTTQLSASVKLQSKLEDITSNSDSAFASNILPLIGSGNSSSLNNFLKISASQIDDLENDNMTEVDQLYIGAARLYVGAYYLFEQPTNSGHKHHIMELFRTTANFVRQIDELDNRTFFLNNAPHVFLITLNLAAFVLMRILKSEYGKSMSDIGGEESFFTAIRLGKRLIIDANDIAGRLITYLTSLWSSTKAFRKADGSEHIGLRIKSRLAMSVVYDSVWWFKEEFDMSALYDERLDRQTALKNNAAGPNSETEPSAALTQPSFDLGGMMEMNQSDWTTFDDPTLAEFAWALSEPSDFTFFPPALNGRGGTTSNII